MKSRIIRLLELPYKGKRGIRVLIAMLLLALIAQSLIACGGNAGVLKTNKINSTELSQDQKDVLDMAGANNEIHIFSYDVEDGFNTLYVTWELYKNGELISDSTFTSGIDENNGMISVTSDNKTGSFVLSHKNGGATSSSQYMLEDDVLTGGYSTAKTWLQEDMPVNSGNEIILMVTVYDNGDALSIFDTDFYEDNPERLSDYDYVQIVKCRFASQPTDAVGGVNGGDENTDPGN